jgi:hypothetical protein
MVQLNAQRSHSALQRAVVHEVLAREQRQIGCALPARWMRRRAAAELNR